MILGDQSVRGGLQPTKLPKCSIGQLCRALIRLSSIKSEDVYAFGIMLMNQIPGFKGNSPSDLCAKFFPGYDRVGVRYKECYLRESKKLYRGLALHAKQTCPASDKESCYYQIAADCLNPDPRLRPSSSGLLKIIPNW